MVVDVRNVSKVYQLGNYGYGTLRHDLESWWSRIRGREDPNSKIGDDTITSEHQQTKFLALDNVSFSVSQGERIGIVGRNGSGKSTILKILSRLTGPTSGSIHLSGRVASLLEVGTGFHPELSGRENVYLNGAILGMRKREIDRRFDEIVAFSEIETFIDTPVKRYSSGMYVRLAFSVAANLDSDILIIDEILAVGDAVFQSKCVKKMNELSLQGGRTVLFVSHSEGHVRSICDRVILFDGGHIVCDSDLDHGYREFNRILESRM